MGFQAGHKLGPYEMLARIGEGGMGEVWKARDTRLGRIVAIKFVKSGFTERLEREARAIATLSHPRICTLHDIGPDYLVMEYIDGRPLRGPLPIPQAIEYALQILDGLAAAHSKDIVHRDLKPDNILLAPGGIKLVDFGLATSPQPGVNAETATVSAPLTRHGAILGTLRYMSPEQLHGRQADARSDLFAFGLVLYEMIGGRRAFDAPSEAGVIAAILERTAPPVSSLRPETPEWLERVTAACLEKDPALRWQSARDLYLHMTALSKGGLAAGRASFRLLPLGFAALWTAAIAAASFWAGSWMRPPSTDLSGPIRLSAAPPPDTSIISLAVSPDGKRLVLNTLGASGQCRLWLRPLDSTEATPVRGADDAQWPFWSPDSRSIGFFAESKLMTVGAEGGAPKTLAGPASGRGGSWNRHGLILFGPSSAEPLYVIPASGGAARAATVLDASLGETAHVWPSFLPDGRHFLYLARSTRPENNAVYAGELGSNQRKRLFDSDTGAVYVNAGPGQGRLVYVRNRTLVAQPFNLRSLDISGPPESLAEAPALDSEVARLLLSASENGVLAFHRSTSRGSRLLWFDRSGKPSGEVGEAAVYNTLRLSPDGRSLAFSRFDPRFGSADLWLSDLARGTISRFTFDPGSEHEPVWSPDGGRILFFSTRTGKWNLYLKSSTREGTEEEFLSAEGGMRPLDWSRDGRYILYTRIHPQNMMDLWAVPAQGERKPFPVLRTPFNERMARFSPDSRWVAYTSNESGRDEIYVIPFRPGVEASPGAGDKWQVSSEGGQEPRWRADGRELYFLAADGKVMAVQIETGAAFNAGTPKPLFAARSLGDNRYDVSADGRRFLIITSASDDVGVPATVILNWTAGLKPAPAAR